MSVDTLIKELKRSPERIAFETVIQVINDNYQYAATRFSNGVDGDTTINEAGTNEGSCKIFAFALLNELDEEQTLACFGQYYRNDVLEHPAGNDHANIRTFMRHGWPGIQFDNAALTAR